MNDRKVLCIKWGTRYGPEYVNRLYGMVARQLTPPFDFVCFTDDQHGIRPEVICHDLPDLGCPVPTNAPGKFRKLALWNADLAGLRGTALFLDLDVVVTGPLDELFAVGQPDEVILARNWIKPLERLGQTSVFRFPIGGHAYLLEEFRADPEGLAGKFQFEQRYVTKRVRGGVRFFPSAWVRHFRLDCLGPWPLRYLRPARLPRDARIVMFPGKPDPADAIAGRWSDAVAHAPPLAHLAGLFDAQRGQPLGRHLKRYLRPVDWVAEHWRE
ncbi:glycosyl transferase [Azonexus caeni]|uniref:glycosyl transferase n=1 Tax=Azonexus caeni TaxID=266126 RepID=UPI003A837FA0